MRVPRIDRLNALAALAAAALLLSCGKAAGVFLDLPEGESQEQEPPAATPAAARPQPISASALPQAQEERPLIEAILDADSVRALLPRDRAGNLDWVAALGDGIIEPRADLPGEAEPEILSGFAYDFLLKGDVPMFDAYFPHSAHAEWSSCRSCHPGIYPYRNTETTMDEVNRGESCGRCHGKVAFPASTCERCHTQMTMPEKRLPPEFLGDLAFTRDQDSTAAAPSRSAFPPARFPHWVHRIRYRCMVCHPEPFSERLGATRMTMSPMQKGELCGRCHDNRAAFGLVECNRCHVPQPATPPDTLQ